MLNRYFYRVFIIPLIAIHFLSACKRENIRIEKPAVDGAALTIGAYIENNYECTILTAALKHTGLMDTLNKRSGTYTLLAADDKAFRKIGITGISDVERLNKDSLRKALLFHILPVRLLQNAIPKQANYPMRTLEGHMMLLSNEGTQNYLYGFSGAEIKKEKDLYVPGGTDPFGGISIFDYAATNFPEQELANGVVQRIDRLIRPYFDENVQDYLNKRPEYSIFVAGLKKFGLWEKLAGKGPFTVCAPTNAALTKWGLTLAVLNTLTTQEYNGNLLFGAYLIEDHQMLIKDLEGQNFYADQIKSVSGYYRFITGEGRTYFTEGMTQGRFFSNRYLGFAYSLVINRVDEPWAYTKNGTESAKDVLGANDFFPPDPNAWAIGWPRNNAVEQLPVSLDRNRCNNLCSNGVVHPFDAIAVLPVEARR